MLVGWEKLDSDRYRTRGLMLCYCRNVHPTWVKFDSKDTKESEWCSRF